MKKINLVKGASLLLALAPAAVLASCGQSNNPIPSKFETVGLGDLWVSKPASGKNFDFKVTLQTALVDYNVYAAIITGDSIDNYEVQSFVNPENIQVVDQYGGHIGTTALGSFSVLSPGDVYFRVTLDKDLEAGKSLAFVTTIQYINEEGEEIFEDIDLCLLDKFVSFGCYINPGIPVIFKGAEIIDQKVDPLFIYARTNYNEQTKEIDIDYSFGYFERLTFGESSYYIAKDFETDEELVVNSPTIVFGLAKLGGITKINNTVEISSIIDLENDSTICYADIQRGETCYFRKKGLQEKTKYDVKLWGRDPLTNYVQTFDPLAVYNAKTGALIGTPLLDEPTFTTDEGCDEAIFTVSNVLSTRTGDIHITHAFVKPSSEQETITMSGVIFDIDKSNAGKHVKIKGENDAPLITLTDSENPDPDKGEQDLNSNFELEIKESANVDFVSSSKMSIKYEDKREFRPKEHIRISEINISHFYAVEKGDILDLTARAIDRTTLLGAFEIIDDKDDANQIKIISISIESIDGAIRSAKDCETLGIETGKNATIKLDFSLLS